MIISTKYYIILNFKFEASILITKSYLLIEYTLSSRLTSAKKRPSL